MEAFQLRLASNATEVTEATAQRDALQLALAQSNHELQIVASRAEQTSVTQFELAEVWQELRIAASRVEQASVTQFELAESRQENVAASESMNDFRGMV